MKIRFHKLAAIAVLIGFSAWIATGEFSSVGSAQSEAEATPPATAAEEAAPPVLRTVAVVVPPRVQHARAIRISGQTQADQRAVLTTRAAGVIGDLRVQKGSAVKAGDVILVLAAEEKKAAFEMAKALLAQRQAEFNAAERLAETGNMPKLQLETSRAALAAAKSQVEAAEADLGRLEVKAPFSGIIDRLDVEAGSSVGQGAQVATLLNLDPIIGAGEVSERDLGHIRIGDDADVRLVNGKMVAGKLRYVSRDASAQTRTFPLEVAIPNADGAIPAGMTAEITLKTEPADAVILPRSVVTLSESGDLGIRAVDKDSKVVFYPIDLVDDMPNGLVLGGIPADARVIVAGQDLVTEGDTVNAVEADQETINRLIGEVTGGTQ
ncbi:MAG: efflux RND transporter periplasmic adaptor subunit [Rhizobiaceae bacterium]|nr:efflux RND transporter periplasmic adaptor subunit [Rhizobiaceae bacterium]